MGSLTGITQGALSGMGGLSAAQQSMIDAASPEQRPLMEAQMKMQKEQEINQLITQMIKALHEMAKAIISNIGT